MSAKNSLLLSFLALFFLLVQLPASAQTSRTELEKRKQENLKKIKEAEKILGQTRTQKRSSLGELTALEEQIEASQNLINILSEEVAILNSEIGELNGIVQALTKDLAMLREEYKTMVYNSYKAQQGFSTLTFLFSSKTFNQLYRRYKWLQQYSEARQLQIDQIQKVQRTLEQQQTRIVRKREEQETILNQQLAQTESLAKLKNQQQQTVAKLSQQESQIQKELSQRKADLKQLDALIAKLVKEEIDRARREEAAKRTAASNRGRAEVPLTPEVSAISTSFEGTRTRMLWPVASGFISSKFGQHQVYKQVKLENSGVEIQTKENELVRSVFDGEVRRVFFMPGMNNVVMIQHGQYFTVYARLKDVSVQAQQKVKSKEAIGTVFTNKEGVSELHFEIWKNDKKLDPEQWLYKN
jgi:septal ring factor EnvC (AmiA/AmiB activator)